VRNGKKEIPSERRASTKDTQTLVERRRGEVKVGYTEERKGLLQYVRKERGPVWRAKRPISVREKKERHMIGAKAGNSSRGKPNVLRGRSEREKKIRGGGGGGGWWGGPETITISSLKKKEEKECGRA